MEPQQVTKIAESFLLMSTLKSDIFVYFNILIIWFLSFLDAIGLNKLTKKHNYCNCETLFRCYTGVPVVAQL